MTSSGQIESMAARLETPEARAAFGEAEHVVTKAFVEEFGDTFETMEITPLGDITIWTSRKVWCIRREGGIRDKLIAFHDILLFKNESCWL